MQLKCLRLKYDIGPELLNYIFIKKSSDGNRILRSKNDFFLPQVNTVHYGHDSLRYFGCKIWGIIPEKIKMIDDIDKFKSMIKMWIPNNCPCRIYRLFIEGLGYI